MGICDGKVVIVTGAGRGIGRGHAIEFARQGAKVVVNDLGGARDGVGGDLTPAQEVVAEIEAMGGEAIANGADEPFYANKIRTGRYYMSRLLPETGLRLARIRTGADPVMALDAEAF